MAEHTVLPYKVCGPVLKTWPTFTTLPWAPNLNFIHSMWQLQSWILAQLVYSLTLRHPVSQTQLRRYWSVGLCRCTVAKQCILRLQSIL